MPGTIVKVNVETGQNVAEGEKLLILEAMKMENPIVSTESGIIKNINISEGDKVSTKQVLVEFE